MFAAALPLLALAPSDDPAERLRDRLLAITAVLPLAAFWVLSPLPGGYQWGGRYFLPSAVLLAVLVWRGLARLRERGDRPAWTLGSAAIVGSVVIETCGLALLLHVSTANAELARAIVRESAVDRPIACATRWLPEILAPAWGERMIFLVDSAAGMRTLARGLPAGRTVRFDLFEVLDPGPRSIPTRPPFCERVAESVLVTPGRRTRHTLLSCRPVSAGPPEPDGGGEP
ncbi:MAG: hypothetical protein D6685_14130 [Bacteroidetes bacterium]|nr:MAG: hypothetical protein D6685_14130 [Bacteroidota bacterium]